MYKCYECGGFVEELGDMAVSDGGCVCAQKKAEESANSLQQLKAEIRSVVDDFVCIPPVRIAQEIDNLIYKLRELSAV